MMHFPPSPFAPTTSSPGSGRVLVASLPPGKQVLSTFTYQYPLKLIAPDPHVSPETAKHPVTVVFLLTYGGGLVGGDKISLDIVLTDYTRLVLLTQGSTKIFKSASRSVSSGQLLNVTVGRQASLCYLPDPTQPFGESVYEQRQTFYVDPGAGSSLCVLDWVSEGRRARCESWTLWSWKARNEFRQAGGDGNGRDQLLLRDSVMLDDNSVGLARVSGLTAKTDGMGIFGTLILHGPTFKDLGDFFIEEFLNMPRIGAKDWSSEKLQPTDLLLHEFRQARQLLEKADSLLWTAARVRSFVVVKFGARETDGARTWLRTMIKHEGSVERQFGHQALLCLR